MNRTDNLDHLLTLLMEERGDRQPLPDTLQGKQRLMRALINVRPPQPADAKLLQAQDRELQWQKAEKGVVDIRETGLVLWQGDITRLRVDAIVNAANSALLGCFVPLHACIDNAIHSAAGIQLRLECDSLMKQQGHEEPTGQAKITKGYNLPATHVIHTVGPIVPSGHPTLRQEAQLAACYRSCLDLAEQHRLRSLAFCCISTGVFHFPNQRAAEIALQTVSNYPRQSLQTIVFNVFTDKDYDIYHRLLHPNP